MSGLKKLVKGALNIATLGTTGSAAAAKKSAAAVQAQTDAQEAQYQQDLLTAQNQSTLNSANDLSNVATVTSGGTAADADTDLSTATKVNRKKLISSTLGLGT